MFQLSGGWFPMEKRNAPARAVCVHFSRLVVCTYLPVIVAVLGVSDSGQLLKSQKPKRFRVVEAPSEG